MITCDAHSCPSLALFRVRWTKTKVEGQLDLFFCGHHYREHLPNLPVGTKARALDPIGEGDWYTVSHVLAGVR